MEGLVKECYSFQVLETNSLWLIGSNKNLGAYLLRPALQKVKPMVDQKEQHVVLKIAKQLKDGKYF